jgi:hypothetical protein
MNSIPHREIAKALNVTRQHVSSLVKRGLPTSSVAEAEAWYRRHVNTRYSKGRHRRTPALYPVSTTSTFTEDWTDLPVDLHPASFGLGLAPHKPRPITLVEWSGENVHTDEEVEAWMNREVTTVEGAVRVSAFLVQLIRLHIDWMPHVMAERVNPLDPDLARQELEHWVKTLNRECFTDGETTPGAG